MGTIDSKSDASAPPSYSAISTSVLSFGASIRRRPSARTVFSWVLGARTTVLSRIHDLVTSPEYTPSSVAPIVNSCATSLSASAFSNLLQSLNIEGHTAMYWAIVNKRREALSAFVGYISQISSVCSDDLRLACILTSDHAMFTQLNLSRGVGPNDKSLRRSLGCMPNENSEVEVYEGDGMDECQFIASFWFDMCQKRLRITHEIGAEFVHTDDTLYCRTYMVFADLLRQASRGMAPSDWSFSA